MIDAGVANIAPPQRAPRWLLLALLASLALNLVVVGLVAGAVWRFSTAPIWANAVAPNLLGYASVLPPQRRKQLLEETAEQRRQLRPFRREVRIARDEAIKALLAEPYDRQQFLAAQAHQAEAEKRARGAVQELFARIADVLTPEERRGFARWREHRRPPGHSLLDESDHQAGDPTNSTK
jgi:uncharacterized membrane protein